MTDKLANVSFFSNEEQAVAAFHATGLHAEFDFFTPHECNMFIEASHTLQNAKNGEFRPTLNPHTESEVFLQAMRDKKLITIIEKLLGGKASGLQTQYFFGLPGTQGFSIHQDNFFVEAQPADYFISTWLALADVDLGNGTIYAFPGAHKEGLLPVKKLEGGAKMGQDSNAHNEVCLVPDRYARLDICVPQGTLVFLHSLTPHGSYDNHSNRTRPVMLNNYIRQGTPFRSGRSAKRKEIPLEGPIVTSEMHAHVS
ncbi:MAG: phytanoyl-CoA dioxygenase family protein [Gammaproteobacteria bacterium]|nr:phytanoyl-CoA dioxygenase family protein [Gammaproteobacteria bacterium]